MVIGHHLIWTLYGHWLPNDPRGSGSELVRQERLELLGLRYFGRRPDPLQPTREELRAFHRRAEAVLQNQRVWLNEELRQLAGESIGRTVAERAYTVWACAVLSNHVHMVVRKHRDDAVAIWNAVADNLRPAIRKAARLPQDHRVLAERPYKVFLNSPEDVWTRVRYVERNPEKEGLPRQEYAFLSPYNNWPFHKR